jgi:hypothetical protein
VEYFNNIFAVGRVGNVDLCLQPLACRVTTEMSGDLTKAFTAEEVSATLFQMAPLKAPGPDVLNACFFQKNWATMGGEVCHVILAILNSGVLPRDLNKTYIALIPKMKTLTSVSNFKPINLCNMLYKLISKVFANRLKKILPTIIAPTQSAFIPRRLITDNILAAYETLHTMHTWMRGKKVSWR